MLDLQVELKKLLNALDRKGVEYALCGGLAMAVHGYVRATMGIDLLILSKDVESAVEEAGKIGYNFQSGSMVFSKGSVHIERVTKIDPEDSEVLWIDFLLVTEPLEGIWNSRETMPWQGGEISVLSKEGLIEMKTFRSSKQDLADISYLKNECNED